MNFLTISKTLHQIIIELVKKIKIPDVVKRLVSSKLNKNL